MSALDDLLHDFVYCLQLSLVLKELRLFSSLLRFPRREEPHKYWTLHCLQWAREDKRWKAGCNLPWLCCFGLFCHSSGFLGNAEGKGQELCHGFPCLVLLLPRHLLLSHVRFCSDSKLFICPTFLPSQNKISRNFKHIRCLNSFFYSWLLSHWGFCVLLKSDCN